MPSPLVLAGISGLTSLATQGLSNEMNLKKSKELAKYAYDKDLEQWNRANEYNLPQNQVFRLKAAGLNPNLVYGNGNAVTLAEPSPRYQTPSVDMRMQAPDVVGTYQNIKNKEQLIGIQQAQMDMMTKQKELIDAQVTKTLAEATTEGYKPENVIAGTNKLNVESDIALKMAPINYEIAKSVVAKNGQEIKNLIATNKLTYAQLKSLNQSIDYLKQHYPQLLNEQDYKNVGLLQDNINKSLDEGIKRGIIQQQARSVGELYNNDLPDLNSLLIILNLLK